jgi:hypothetical protein
LPDISVAEKKQPRAFANVRRRIFDERSADQLRRCFLWRSQGETKRNLKNTDKTSTNQLGCRVSDTTGEYHPQRQVCHPFFGFSGGGGPG